MSLLDTRSSEISNYFLNLYKIRNASDIIGIERNAVKKPKWYHQLPRRVLLNIFGHFSEKDLQVKIMPVCRQWKHAAMDPSLWKTLKITNSSAPARFICAKLRCFPTLETVHVEKIEEPMEVIRQICRSNSRIKVLRMRCCQMVQEVSLRNLIKCCKALEVLDMKGTPIKGNTCFVELGGLKHLKEVNFSDNRYFTVNNLMSVVINCRKLRKIEATKLIAVQESSSAKRRLQDEDVKFIISHISPDLHSLILDTSTLTLPTFERIFKCSQLQHIGLFGASNLTGELFTTIWKALPKLTKIQIHHAYNIGGDHVISLFTNGCDVMKNLTLLDFTGCWKVTDEGIKTVAEVCPKLKEVVLKACKSLSNISPLLENCKEIELLNIAFCYNIEPKNVRPIPQKLNAFYIHDIDVFSELLEVMRKQRKIHVYICWSEYNNCLVKRHSLG